MTKPDTSHHASYKRIGIEDIGAIAGTSPGILSNSSPRTQMVHSQSQQCVTPYGSEPPIYMTGLEDQLAQNTFHAKAPCDMEVIAVINKYPRTMLGRVGIENPQMTIIYLDHTKLHEDGIYSYGLLTIDSFQNQSIRTHTKFSYNFEKTDAAERISPGQMIPKGTQLTKTPNDHGGVYGTGVILNAAYHARHPTIEDGFMVRRAVLEKLTTMGSSEYTTSWGATAYPLLCYGDRVHPDIGEKVRDDSLLFATRDYHPVLDGVLMTRKNLRRPSSYYDNCTYIESGSVVRDVTVFSSTRESSATRNTPKGLEKQDAEYVENTAQYYRRVLEVYQNTIRKNTRAGGANVELQPALHNEIAYAYGDMPNTNYRRITNKRSSRDVSTIRQATRAVPVDEWQITIQTSYDFLSGLGAKLTGTAGNKGVICTVGDDEELGKDEHGRQIDILFYGMGAVNRINPGQFEEQLCAAYSEHVRAHMMLAMDETPPNYAKAIRQYDGFLEAVSHTMHSIWQRYTEEEKLVEVQNIYRSRIYMVSPPNDWAKISDFEEYMNFDDMQSKLLRRFGPLPASRITYKNDKGEIKTSLEPIVVAPMYFWELEKMSHNPFGTSGLKRQHHGIPAKEGRSAKYSQPSQEKAPRAIGESEHRLLAAALGGLNLQTVTDLSTNPEALYSVHKAIYASEDFASIQGGINRDEIPYNARAVSLLQNLFASRGLRLEQRPVK